MKKSTQILASVCCVIMLHSCATKIPFTQAIREKYQISDEELKHLQFYISHDVVLSRVSQDEKTKTLEDGTLKITTGKEYDEVLLKSGTPGVVENVLDEKRIAVSFEAGENKYIVFGDPNDRKGNYTLLAAEWKNNRGILKYGNQEYYANQGASNVYLMFKMRSLNKIKGQTKIVKGRRL